MGTQPKIYVLSKNEKNIKTFLLKLFPFYNLKNLCFLHGHVFVMSFLNLIQYVSEYCGLKYEDYIVLLRRFHYRTSVSGGVK